jgi:DNA-binding NarL/FixJ family response regulator
MPHSSQPSTAPPRVVIIDADRRVQQSLSDLLRVSGQVAVIGGAGDVRGALDLVDRERPDCVLVDPRLPDVEAGMALVGGLGRAWPQLRIILTGWPGTDGNVPLADERTRYVSKDGSPEQFVTAIVDACCT